MFNLSLRWVLAILAFIILFRPRIDFDIQYSPGQDAALEQQVHISTPPREDPTGGGRQQPPRITLTTTVTRTAPAATAVPELVNAYAKLLRNSLVINQDAWRLSQLQTAEHFTPGEEEGTGAGKAGSSAPSREDWPRQLLWGRGEKYSNVLRPSERADSIARYLMPQLLQGRSPGGQPCREATVEDNEVLRVLTAKAAEVRYAEDELLRLDFDSIASFFILGSGESAAEVARNLRLLAADVQAKTDKLLPGRETPPQQPGLLWRLVGIAGSGRKSRPGNNETRAEAEADSAVVHDCQVAKFFEEFLEFRETNTGRWIQGANVGLTPLDDKYCRKCLAGQTDIDGGGLRAVVRDQFHVALDRAISAANTTVPVVRTAVATWQTAMMQTCWTAPTEPKRTDEGMERAEEGGGIWTLRYWRKVLRTARREPLEQCFWNWEDFTEEAKEQANQLEHMARSAEQLRASGDALLEGLSAIEAERVRILGELRDMVKKRFVICTEEWGQQRPESMVYPGDYVECVRYVFPEPAVMAKDITLALHATGMAHVMWFHLSPQEELRGVT